MKIFKLLALPFIVSGPERLPNVGYLSSGYDIYKGNPRETGSVDPGFRLESIFNLTLDGGTTSDGRYILPKGVVAEQYTSEAKEQRHEESKNFTISEQFTFPPYSKTDISFLLQQVNYNLDFGADIIIGGFFFIRGTPVNGDGYFRGVIEPGYIFQRIQARPDIYSEQKETNVTGRMKGVYCYKLDSKKNSTPLGNPFPTKTVTETKTETKTETATQTMTVAPTNQANYLTPNKYASIGLALLAGLLLKS
ncbi:6260_t:CDS:2 [Funneliformis geosporum]|uniref:6260_t:CDS:1 n=1 Tax=Funneliformis geosporum TaxID=1117311 RepID=A0A9W4WY08_9GLOM|nr:6260_t:CDS:2 [Funneliformis geosporum]